MFKVIRILVFFVFVSFAVQGQNQTIQNIINETNIDSLIHFVQELSGEISTTINGAPYTIASRYKTTDGNAKAAVYIKQKFQSYGLTAVYQDFGSLGRNVYAEQTGTDFPDKKFIICAHYDDMPSSGLAPGADDNGSGSAAVIEAARVLTNYSFPYTIVYALWDEEEQGLVGSGYYAGQAAAAGDQILGVINMDMIAYDGDGDKVTKIHTQNVADSYTLSNKMMEINTLYNIGLVPIIRDPGLTASDHASFWNNGYSAILIIEDYANDFNPYYHSSNDLLLHYDYDYYHKSAQLSIATFATFALNLNITIDHTPFSSIDYSADMLITADIITGLTLGTGASGPRLYYRVDSGLGFSDFIEVAGTSPSRSGAFNFIIPAQSLGTKVQYYLAAQDADASIIVTLPEGGGGYNPPGSIPPDDVFQFYVAPMNLVFTDNGSDLNNWQSNGGWNITTEKFVSSPTSLTDSPNSEYSNNTDASLTTSQPIFLNDAIGASLQFQSQWVIESDWDFGQVLISTNGTSWQPLQGMYTNEGTGSFQPNGEPVYDGAQNSWVQEEIDLSDYIGENVQLRFRLKSDGYVTEDGWYIDDVNIFRYEIVPVELLNFTANVDNQAVILNWSTATELNNFGFEIERSYDNQGWLSVAFIDGRGTISERSDYSYSDKPNSCGTIFYRLIQKDFDGSEKIYGPLSVEFLGNINYALEQNYPNPFNPTTKISFSIPIREAVFISIVNSLGQTVAVIANDQFDAGIHSVNFNASDIPSGVYFYSIKAGEFTSVKKMMVLK